MQWNVASLKSITSVWKKCNKMRRFQSWMLNPIFCSIFRPLLNSMHICVVVCIFCVNAHCITTDTQAFVYNFIFHVFRSLRSFFHSLSHCSITLLRDMFVFTVFYVHTLWKWKKNCNNNNSNPTVHTDVRIVKQILWYL